MQNLGPIKSFTLGYDTSVTANKTNGGQTVISVKFDLKDGQIYGEDNLYFTLPSELGINPVGTSFSCTPATCTRSGKNIVAKVHGSKTSARYASYSFKINGVINPSNTRTTSKVSNIFL